MRRTSRDSFLIGLALVLCSVAGLCPSRAHAQGLTGSLIGTVRDVQGGTLAGAVVQVTSPALIGGPATLTTSETGQLRFPALSPGRYALRIRLTGFATFEEADISIGAGATIERTIVLTLAGVAESVVVEGPGSRIDARDPGFGTRLGPEDLAAIPTRRASMFDAIRAAPGISPTSPGSGTVVSFSAFGSGTNENQFLFDGTNFTCPCNGDARAEPGVDFIQEVHVQSVGASAEFGNVQGAVINVVTRQGGERFLYEAAYFGQAAGLTAQPVRLPVPGFESLQSGYERARYRDFSTSLGGPVVRDRLWFFTGYQHVRDYDSQPGAAPMFPRRYEQDNLFGKLTWRLAPGWQLVQSVHQEHWVNPGRPTRVTPAEATTRTHASVPAITFGHLTHTLTPNTLWDVRVGRFVHSQESLPSTGDTTIQSRMDRLTGVTTGAPPQFGSLTISRTTVKSTITHFRPGLFGVDHQLKAGAQAERGEHQSSSVIPGGERFIDDGGRPFQMVSSAPSNGGGMVVTAAAFASDAITVGDRLTVSAGVRFDHSRAISQDVRAPDAAGRETDAIVSGLGTLYTWNIVSPRLGVTAKLTADGRTILRGSYGRFSQGVLTGEIAAFHPGGTPVTTRAFDPATGGYTRLVSTLDRGFNLQNDPRTRAPHTDEFSIGVDREIRGRLAAAVAYVRKAGDDFIGWTDVGGHYIDDTRTLPDGRSVPVATLVSPPAARQFLLTNPPGYSLTYNGVVMVLEKRRARGWQAFGSYTRSRVYGLQPSSGTTAAGAQVSTIGPPNPLAFGRDPNDLTNARGRLPNDRPHMLRAMTSVDVPRTGIVLAANLQYFSGKPWAATAQIALPQGDQRVLLEPRGSRRLSSQTLLDLRVSRAFRLGPRARVELLLDLLNALDETAEEGLATDNLFSPTFGQPAVFVDPRRVMFGLRVDLGR